MMRFGLSEPTGTSGLSYRIHSIDPDRLLIVNLTSWDDSRPDTDPRKDSACILFPSEHPFVKHKTCVYYRGAQVASVQHLQFRLSHGELEWMQPASAQLLQKMRSCAGDSLHMALEHYRILEVQHVT
ncbi:MAG TPA: hypothetical protein PK867_05090 [Pirellulales bacterium]|nr:hypothetical protein [Pirellulales bacterium]